MGFLHSISFETMLDVGSGRGVFLMPFMKEFPWVQVTALDLLEKKVVFLNDLADGGFPQLHAEQKNICAQPFPENSFDVVTLLEVLEHIPAVEKAVEAAVGMAKQYVVVTVPSKPDDNPEHIHLLTKEKLTQMFHAAGCERLHFDGVEGHLFLVAALE
jgi:2-polyprenyl-3-methyl-5-hydroxy-6-metoxy-1,4-benzoquinol methylase